MSVTFVDLGTDLIKVMCVLPADSILPKGAEENRNEL